jgi:hypothetical protein
LQNGARPDLIFFKRIKNSQYFCNKNAQINNQKVDKGAW